MSDDTGSDTLPSELSVPLAVADHLYDDVKVRQLAAAAAQEDTTDQSIDTDDAENKVPTPVSRSYFLTCSMSFSICYLAT